MMDTTILTPQDLFIKVIRYEVPPFQRPYIWTQVDQWEPLWEDVSDIAAVLVENGVPNRHFMGAIVLQHSFTSVRRIETRVVVDGQQRLTTLQLLLDAVQEVCEHDGYNEPADRLRSLVHTPRAYRAGDPDFAFKVWPTIYDQPAFRHAMSNELSSEQHEGSRIVSAHNYFKNKARQWLSGFPDDGSQRESAADALERAVCGYLELVVIELRQSDDPHVIFETLNARGTPLLPSDMVKNQILHEAGIGSGDWVGASSDDAERLWPFGTDWWRQEIGRGHQRRPRIDTFLNSWLTLRNRSETKAHNEFPAFKRYVDQAKESGTAVDDIAGDIGRLGAVYRTIDQCSILDIEPFLYRRSVLGVGVAIPVLLWLLSLDVPSEQLQKSLRALESYLIRRMACGMSARSYNKLFIGLLSELDDRGRECAGDTVVEHLGRQTAHANLWPSDETLRNAFVSEPLYWSLTAGRLNLILQGLEGELRSDWSEDQAVPRNLHIEHVMPQGWQIDRWPFDSVVVDRDEASEKRGRLVHTIGNLTLVNHRLNSSLSNAAWREKRRALDEHTVLFLNKDLLAKAPPVWDESAIAERGERLWRLAVRVWPHAASII